MTWNAPYLMTVDRQIVADFNARDGRNLLRIRRTAEVGDLQAGDSVRIVDVDGGFAAQGEVSEVRERLLFLHVWWNSVRDLPAQVVVTWDQPQSAPPVTSSRAMTYHRRRLAPA